MTRNPMRSQCQNDKAFMPFLHPLRRETAKYSKLVTGAHIKVARDMTDDDAILTANVAGDEGRVLCVEMVEGAALAATNWYRRVEGAWRMIHHQASPIAMVED